jgi:hypothetical protein
MSDFIEVHIVSTRPGNPVLRGYIKAESIHAFNVPPEETAKIGVGCSVDMPDGTMYVTKSVDEVFELLVRAKVSS